MLTLFCAVAMAAPQVPLEQPPRLRTVLPSGAIILVERIPKARGLSIGLFASSRTTPETPATHGYRHLIEHLVALGKEESLDRRLEAQGGFLQARTDRDVMSFLFSLPAGGLKLGLDATAELLTTAITKDAAIKRELKVLAQEQAIREPDALASVEAWSATYGSSGLDPFGDLTTMERANPAVLESIRRSMFAPSNLVLVIAGDVDLDAATTAAKAILPAGSPPKGLQPTIRKPLSEGLHASRSGGYAWVPVPGFRRPETTAFLAAGLALASELHDSSFVYTPSGQPGVIVVGTEGGAAELQRGLSEAESSVLFERGRRLAKRWIAQKLSTPESLVSFRGALLSDARDLRPETLLENLENMTFPAFDAAMKVWTGKEGGR